MKFTASLIDTQSKRSEIQKEFANREFDVTVSQVLTANSWYLSHPDFAGDIYCRRSKLLDPGLEPMVGDRLRCGIAFHRKSVDPPYWEFAAIQVRAVKTTASPSVPAADWLQPQSPGSVETGGPGRSQAATEAGADPVPSSGTVNPPKNVAPSDSQTTVANSKGIVPPGSVPPRLARHGSGSAMGPRVARRIVRDNLLREVLGTLVRKGMIGAAKVELQAMLAKETPVIRVLDLWRPVFAEWTLLKELQERLASALNTTQKKTGAEHHANCLAICLKLPAPFAAAMIALLDTMFVPDTKAAAGSSTARPPTRNPVPAGEQGAPMVGASKASGAPVAAPSGIGGSPGNLGRSKSWSDATALRVDSWDGIEPLYTIYVDESWPGHNNQGVLAGVIWRGAHPEPEVLPIPRQHLRGIQNGQRHLANLRDCAERCTPFVFRFTAPPDLTPQQVYEQMVHDTILLLLGWVIPRPPVKDNAVACVKVVCEAINFFPDGHDHTDIFKGMLRQAGKLVPERYGCWGISSFVWRQKLLSDPLQFTPRQIEEQGYLGFADLLAYLAWEQINENARIMADNAHIGTMKTRLTINSSTIGILDRIESAGGQQQIHDLLDVLEKNRHTVVYDRLIDNLRQRALRDAELVKDLFEVLDRNYRAKIRDLRRLDAQYAIVRAIVGEIPPSAPLTLQLAEASVRLQRANHFGNPVQGEDQDVRYGALRERALDNGLAEQVMHLELNLAVRMRDRFEPQRSRLIAENLLAMESRFALASRAKLHSSLAQDLAMSGHHAPARAAFDRALELLASADLADDERNGEWDQTAIYRAISAIDDEGATDRVMLVEEVLVRAKLGSLAESTTTLAVDASPEHQYRHHLLLRLLDAEPELESLRQTYFNRLRRHDSDSKHQIESVNPSNPSNQPKYREPPLAHPWELINLYRGLLACHRDEFEYAATCFENALRICFQESHGVTLRIIGAMVATVAWAATRMERFRDLGREIIRGPRQGRALPSGVDGEQPAALGDLLPATTPWIEVWNAILDNPTPQQEDGVLARKLLPFNYR